MLDGSDQRRNCTSRKSFSSPSSLNSLRVSGRSRRNDDSIRSYDYQRDPTLDQDPQVDGDVETVTEPLEMYDGGSGASRRRTNTSIAPATQQVIKLVPSQGYHESQNDCPQSYVAGALSFPSILCIPCPCVSGPNAQNCPPTCVTYHPVDASAAQAIPQPSNTQAVTPHLPTSSSLPIPASSMVPQTQVNHIYTYGNGGQFERDHHFPPGMPSACCGGQLQLPQRYPPPPPPQPCYETQQSCPFNPNNSFSSTSYFHESPQSTCGGGGGSQGCCPATSNDYRYFAPRRRRRCRREYYLQITKGKCRTGLEDDDSEDTGKSISTAGPGRVAGGAPGTGSRTTMPASRPTHFPINFRLQKASMNEPITRPALPPTRPALTMGRPAMPTMRPALPSTSFSSKSSDSTNSKSSSMNESNRSLSSVATNKSALSSNSPQMIPNAAAGSNGNAPSDQNSETNPSLKKIPPPAMKMQNANGGKNTHMEKPNPTMDKPSTHVGKSNGNEGKTDGNGRAHGHMGKHNAHVGKKLVFNTQGNKKSSSTDGERPRFGSVPLIQETAASVLRKRHNEIRMQAIREMLEKDMRRLKHA